MSSLLRALLLASIVAVLYMMVVRPREFRQLGQKLRLLGVVYVVAVLISAALQLAGIYLAGPYLAGAYLAGLNLE